MSDLEKRLANTEKALLTLWELMKDTMPPDYQGSIDNMLNDFFDANSSLGSLEKRLANTEKLLLTFQLALADKVNE